MFNMKKSALAVAAVLAVAASGTAQASVLATSMIDMTNFVIRTAQASAGGAIVNNGTQVTVTNFASNADQDATLGGASLSNNNPGSATSIDFAPICVGSGCNPIGPNNTFPALTGPTAINFAAADQLEAGAPITGLTGFPGPAGARVSNGAYVGIADGSTAGSANSNNGLNVQFLFIATANGSLTFEFDARAYQEAFVSASEKFGAVGTYADTSYKFGFTITDIAAGQEVFSWKPDGLAGNLIGTEHSDPFSLNDNCSAQPTGIIDFKNTCGNHVLGTASTGFFSASTLALTAGRLYQLNAFINTDVNAGRIPEPATLALAGLSLVGLGIGRYRRRNK